MPFDDAGQRPELKNPRTKELKIVDQMIALLGREGGWTQGQFAGAMCGDAPSYCLLGALGDAEEGNHLAYKFGRRSLVLNALAFAITRTRTGGGFSRRERVVANWNDTVGRSQGDILNLLCRVRAEFE